MKKIGSDIKRSLGVFKYFIFNLMPCAINSRWVIWFLRCLLLTNYAIKYITSVQFSCKFNFHISCNTFLKRSCDSSTRERHLNSCSQARFTSSSASQVYLSEWTRFYVRPRTVTQIAFLVHFNNNNRVRMIIREQVLV